MPLLHTRLLVSNFPACFRFYRDILHLKPSWGDEADSYASFTQEGEERIVLAIFNQQAMAEVVGRGDWPPAARTQDQGVLIFQVSNLDIEVEKLKQQGVQVVAGPADFPDWGIRCAYLRDPDGNLIELCSGLARDAWSEDLRAADEKWHPPSAGA
jgi:catechol 2,3-dioxygenase-like lactoylglutathione lyase family enzyme